MATILDLGLLRGFADIFVWLLVFLIVYGAFEATNFLKNRGLHALIAFVLTAVIVLTSDSTKILISMAPWFFGIAVLMFFMLLLAAFAGADLKDLPSIFAKKSVIWIVAIPLIIILIVSWTQTPPRAAAGEPASAETQQEPQPRGYVGVLTDPKVLGLVLLFAIGAMTLALMTGGGSVGGH